jgi:hypothetical protein
MRIIDETGKSKGPYITVVDAKYIEDYRILVTFNDGIARLVDFGGFLRTARHPDIRKYLDIEEFKKFEIVYGQLEWPNLDLVFPIIELYRGKIEYTVPQQREQTSKGPSRKVRSIPSTGQRISNTKKPAHA